MLAGYETKNFEDIVRSAEIVLHINREMSLHLEYCAEFGLPKAEIVKIKESQACTAYTRSVLDTGSSDWLALQIVLAPCLIGYGVIAKRLLVDSNSLREGNRYWKWIETDAAAAYSKTVEHGIGSTSGCQNL
jgi:thiaminase